MIAGKSIPLIAAETPSFSAPLISATLSQVQTGPSQGALIDQCNGKVMGERLLEDQQSGPRADNDYVVFFHKTSSAAEYTAFLPLCQEKEGMVRKYGRDEGDKLRNSGTSLPDTIKRPARRERPPSAGPRYRTATFDIHGRKVL